ncbi:hypothetical protein [Sunxiuqinia indica]|uniref:hypothetical protein n=1 Tax=Sunxiuqinia indica TaxID=2692584 RepID=UPI00135BDE46|nr:hypothetical protein [Sunxiuqinia indica]
MKTKLIILLIILLVANVKIAYPQKTGKARSILSNIQLEQMKQMPPDEAKIFRDSIIQAWADFRVDSIRQQMQKQRELPTGQISETFDWGPTLEHSPFDLTANQQDSVKRAQRKIIARYKKTPFTQLDKCDKEIVMIAKAKLTMLTYAPAYYREGPNVAPPLIGEEIADYDRPYSEIRFSYDPEQEAHYAYFEKSELPDDEELSYRYRYHDTLRWGAIDYLDLYPNVMVRIWTDTGEVQDIMIGSKGYALDTGSKNKRLLKRFRYNTMHIKDDKLREKLEAPILKKQKESSE